MKASPSCDLSPEDKRLLNVLQIKLYDISQNIEILGKQLTNNQIKDIVSMSYSIFSQLKIIAQKSGTMFLYNLHKKMQVNSVLICALLTERLDKRQQPQQITCKCQQSNSTPSSMIIDKTPQVNAQSKKQSKIPRLGGIDIYNESHKRGLQTINNFFPQTQGRAKKKMVRQCKQQFITAIMSELQDKAEVEVESINDEIKNYIVNFKETSRAFNLFSCETELQEIIDFFKMSQLQAINFLNKSPNNNNEYTEDYLNRLSDLETDIKAKETEGKGSILEKMNHFVQKLRQQVAEVETLYEQKNAKLVQYEKSLKKVTSCTGTQTYDGYQRRIKELEAQLRDQEEKCHILNQIRKEEHNYEDQIHNLNQLLDMKINEIKKVKNSKIELEEELAALKKLMRENNERLTSKFQVERKRNKVKQMLIEPFSQDRNDLQSPDLHQLQRTTLNRQYSQQRNSRRYERTMNNSSENNRVSLDAQKLRMLAAAKGEYEVYKQIENARGDVSAYGAQSAGSQQVSRQVSNSDPKQSGFKQQFRKTNHNHTSYLKKISEEERQVSFKVCQDSRTTEKNFKSSELAPQQLENNGGKSIEKSRSMVSIEDQDDCRRSNRKNTLRQRIDRVATSMKDLEEDDLKKSSKSISKRCIILKEKKEKNIITTMLKLNNFLIQVQYSLQVEPTIERAVRHTVNDSGRETRPSFYNSPSFKAKNSQKNIRLNNLTKSKKDLLQKKEFKKQNNNISQNRGNITNNQAIEEENVVKIAKQGVVDRKIPKAERAPNQNKIQENRKEKIQEGSSTAEKADDRKIQKISKATSLRRANRQKDSNQSDSHLPDPVFSNILKNVGNRQRDPQQLSVQNPTKTEFLCKLSTQQLQFIKQLGQGGSKLKDGKKSSSHDYQAKMNAIKQAFEKQNLDFKEFQQMIKIISYSQPLHQDTLQAVCETVPSNIEIFQATKASKAFDTKGALKRKEQKLLLKQQKVSLYPDNNLLLSGTEIEQIKQIHVQSGNCRDQQQSGKRYCQHIQKYFDIIMKIHAVGVKTRIPLKLPIEKIGLTGQQQLNQENRQYTNQNSTKKTTVPTWKQTELTLKRSNNQQLSSFASYLCDREEKQERQRMLPIISQTTANYYKPKSKLAR